MKLRASRSGVAAALTALLLPGTVLAVDFTGNTSGIFINPVGEGPGAVLAGVGTSTFQWGDGSAFGSLPSSLSFSGATFGPVASEASFGLGTLTYYNGTIAAGTGATAVDLAVTIDFTDPATLANQSFTFPFSLVNTPNSGSPEDQADIVELGLGKQSIFEFLGVSYTLDLAFGDLTGNSWGDANTFKVAEGLSGTAKLNGIITTNIRPVPDAGSTLILLGTALMAVQAGRRLFNT